MDEREKYLFELLSSFADRVEKTAFQMEAPNEWTPVFVQIAMGLRAEINRLRSEPQTEPIYQVTKDDAE